MAQIVCAPRKAETVLLRVPPIVADADFHHERRFQIGDAFHFAFHQFRAEAFSFLEKAPGVLPFYHGVRAALLNLTGQEKEAELLLADILSGKVPGGAISAAYFYTFTGSLDRAAVWWEKVIEQRFSLMLTFLRGPIAKPLRESPYWPRLAKMMNLPVPY